LITLQLIDPPGEIDAGAGFSILLTITAPPECDHRGAPFIIKDADRTVLAGKLPKLTGELHDTAEIALAAPGEVGEFQWTLVLPAREVDGRRCDEASLPFSFRTKPHATSLAVWETPSPVVAGETFSVNVGATCTAGCALGGKRIEIRNAEGTVVAAATLGDSPWPGTTALYWTAVDVQAPKDEGRFSWNVSFSPAELQLPHGHASASLGLLTVAKSDHEVCVRVIVKDTHAPLADVQVRLGAHRASTDETGTARLAVPAGEHTLSIWKTGYDAPDRTICVTASDEVQVEVAALPEPDPFAFWRG
jgi:hypothetical protein